ncbi:hypothetical protein QYE76_040284 [Lolium multiflorum]|uniref:DUF4218 domain-containing protein n=1 Tax=Lolium multiflorum TaxID=4521 RepID=A0AAD8TD35_LOLMU|nr:hypothetical protein QYE76_040284 [Lolium multiflorum]
MWKKKSIFWELEYWKVLEVRSAIDVMHLTKNLCVNILGFLGVYGKTKDTTEAREDQEHHKGRDGNHPGKFEGPASYALTKQEKEIFFEALFIASVALRGLLPENVRLAIVKICAFLNAISQKVMDPETLSGLQADVVECLVSFELLFPPSFFNIMTHLLVHLVEEIRILGPVFLHNMFPFERFMGVLKKYVHNRARPEGSISKGYGTEEVIEFCVDFLPDHKPIGVPESRYEGRLTGKGTLGRKAKVCRDKISFNQAHYTVLYNSSLVAPYIEKHKNVLREINPGQPESLITHQHVNTFGSWLQRHLMNTTVVEQLYLLEVQNDRMAEFQRQLDQQQREIQQQQREINELKGQRQPDNTAGISQRRDSSVADLEAPPLKMIDGGPGDPVDGIKEQTPCDLHEVFRNLSVKVAVGYVLPAFGAEGEPATWHGNEIPAGYARVGVDSVVPSWETLQLEIPGGDGGVTLGEVLGEIIVWEKKN